MGDLTQIVWGIDGTKESVLDFSWLEVSEMNFSEVDSALRRFDKELSDLEEETDYKDFCQLGGKENSRKEKAKLAEERKAKINQPGGTYSQLIARFGELATEPIDRRAADLRNRRSLYDTLYKLAC